MHTKRISETQVNEILDLHKKGESNHTISKITGVSRPVIAYHLKTRNLKANGQKRKKLEIVDEKTAKCSKCNQIRDLDQFLYNRKYQKYEYRFSYCLECRRKQLNNNLNSSKYKYLKNRFNVLKRKAIKKGIHFNLDFDYFKTLLKKQHWKCFYTKEKLYTQMGNGLQRNTLSIDRLDSNKGYVMGNIVFCTHKVNTIKSDLSLEELKKWIPKWYKKIVKFQQINQNNP